MNSPFIDVPRKPLFREQGTVDGSSYLKDLRKLSVGVGSEVVRADRSGLWAGGKKFEDAPFRVDMQGRLIATSPSGVSVVIDTVNGRIIVYDANGVARIVIGYLENAF